jgi:hypothetical protein
MIELGTQTHPAWPLQYKAHSLRVCGRGQADWLNMGARNGNCPQRSHSKVAQQRDHEEKEWEGAMLYFLILLFLQK